MRRILSIWLPQWPIDRLRRATQSAPPDPPQKAAGVRGAAMQRPEPPLALTLSGAHGLRITALNRTALDHGLQPGMPLADARAILPALAARPAEPEADAAALLALAEWCGQFSPWTNRDPPDGLWLDTTGSSHLFGGEAALLTRLGRRLAGFGIEARLGLADTPGGAWALARHGPNQADPGCMGPGDMHAVCIAPPGQLKDALAPLPVEALRLSEETSRLLRRLGLRRIGQLYELPRTALGHRFAAAEKTAGRKGGETTLLRRLDEALGRVRSPLSPLSPAPDYRARATLAEPLLTLEALSRLLDGLLEELCGKLKQDGKGARRLALFCYRVDGSLARQSVALARPSQEPAHCRRLFAERLEEIDAGFGIETLVLAAECAEPLEARQADLDDNASRRREEDLAQLIDRLSNRLGPNRVKRVRPRESHLPELAVIHRAAAAAAEREGDTAEREEAAAPWPEPPGGSGPRPFRLLPRPEPIAVTAEIPEGPPLSFTWRRQVHRVARAEGPERIAPEWWQDSASGEGGPETMPMTARLRDYYRVEDAEGRRYWLFRAGLYGEGPSAEAPAWYLHGFFG